MLEQLINALDQRGLVVLQALIGRRAIELLEAENDKQEKKPKSNLLLPNQELVKGH